MPQTKAVSIELLEALATNAGSNSSGNATKQSTNNTGSTFIDDFAKRHGLEVRKRVTMPDGTLKLMLGSCPFGGDTHKSSAMFESPDGRRGFHCFHASCADYHWSDLRQLLEPDVPDQPSADATGDEPWPEPQPIESELPPVPRFDCGLLLPSPLREWVLDVSARMQVVPDLPAVAIISGLAACIGRRAQILPKAVDYTFIVIAVIWTLLVARAGTMKTPTLLAALEPIRLMERVWREEYNKEAEEYAKEIAKYEAQLAAWKDKAKAEAKKGAVLDAPPKKPDPPVARRVVVNHASFEALQLILSQNCYGLLELRDEVSSWLTELDAPANASIRGLYLQAWTGRGDYVIDRIGRGTIVARDVCLSVVGGITPERLHGYVGDVYAGAAPDDGLLQRFGLAVEPDPPMSFEYTDRRPDDNAMEQVSYLLTSLLALQPETPYTFRFCSEAQELYIDWLTRLESVIRGKALAAPLVSHLAKYRSLMPALSLVFEIASRATGSGPGFGLDLKSNLVMLKSAQLAATWTDAYLQPHARRIYARPAASAVTARELGRRILAREVGENGVLNARAVYRRQLSGLRDAATVHGAAAVLCARGWLRPVNTSSKPEGGRPAENWSINPRLWEGQRSASELIPEI